MKTFLAAALFLGLGVFIMCFNIIFRNKEFPNSDVGSNEEMKKIGIRCYKEIDAELHRTASKKNCSGNYSSACEGCNFYGTEKRD